MRALLAAVVAAAALLGGAGALSLALERRLTTLTPGGVEIAALHYNPFSGRLALAGVCARDADGREVFRAERVEASARLLPLLVGALTLTRVRVEAPRFTLTAAPPLADLPLRIEDLVVTGAHLAVAPAGTDGPALRARDLDVRLGRLTTVAAGGPDLAFAAQATVFGTVVRVTGQPQGRGYALHVRARDVDVAALARDLPGRALAGVRAGRGEVDTVLQVAGDRLLAAGHARVADLVLALPVRGRPRLRAGSVAVVSDGLDLFSGTGRLTRVVVGGPSLSLPLATAAPTLTALLQWLRAPADLRVRRVAVSGGTLALTGAGGVRLERVQVAAQAFERRGTGSWTVTARAALDNGADVALEGQLARDLRALDAATRIRRAAVTPWRALTGMATDWDARVAFDGRLRVAAREGAATLTGQASLQDAHDETGGPVEVHRRVATADPAATIRQLLAALEDAAHAASAGD